MTTPAPLTVAVPTVTLVRHAAPSGWTATQRRDLASELRALGTTITELSDARELLGFDRLSEGSDWDREHAVENLESPELQEALAEVRRQRADLLQALAETVDWKARRRAHKLLNIKGETDRRLGELQALYAQARICELANGGEVGNHSVAREYQLCERAQRYTGVVAL